MSCNGRFRRTATAALSFGVLLLAAAPAAAEVKLPQGGTLKEVDFERHIMGLFGRMGCNAGSCHGSFQGKGGLQLSLFGYEPAKDYLAITRDMHGRRINVSDPDQSLLLLKATGQADHGGSVRFSPDSWQYQVMRAWIAAGAKWNQGSGEVEKITIAPAELSFHKPGEAVQLKVTARFRGGDESDITAFCDFRTLDDAVAEAGKLGEVKALRAGSTAVIVTYRGHVNPVNVLIPLELPKDFVYPKVPENNFIDRIVFARLKKLNMVPSELSSDTEFLRRVYLDTIGTLPTPDEVRAFLKDTDPNKRSKLIDRLLEHPAHAALWATKFCDITGNDTNRLEQPVPLKPKRSQMWHDWFRKRISDNVPYDEIVRGVLTATSRGKMPVDEWVKDEVELTQKAIAGFDFQHYADREYLDLYWRTQQKVPIEQWGEKTAAAFMGIRLECAQCHKHPFDRWSQAEYRAYANIFTQVNFAVSPEARQALTEVNKTFLANSDKKKKNLVPQFKEVYVSRTPVAKALPHPDTQQPLPPQALGGPVIQVQPGEDAREKLFEWLRAPENPFFAKSFVNRVWGHYFGQGIVDPVDDFSLANPASNEELLQALAQEFTKNKYNIREMERLILNSRTYQLSSKTNATNKLDKRNFSHAYVRPMMAEVVIDALNAALGTTENFGPGIREGSRAIEVGPSLVQGQVAYAFRIFGRPPRTAACDCERAMDPALPQKLYTMTDTAILQKLGSPQGRLAQLLKTQKSDDEIFEEMVLATLSRFPTDEERRFFAEYRQRTSNRRQAFEDAMWALINTREFILNH